MSTRTFIAVAFPKDVRQRALVLMSELRTVAEDVKWVAAENLHWTLQFLGDVDDLEIPAVCDAVAAAAAECEPFELEIRGAGAFPSPDRPRTLWLGAGQGSAAMVGLQGIVERTLKKLGYRGEHRRYVPHVTLGRIRHGRPPRELAEKLTALEDFDAGAMLVDEVLVVASELTPTGSEYHILGRAPLAPD
jgi:RNA 2',3'-cyclic 3'-phosphodiesterase